MLCDLSGDIAFNFQAYTYNHFFIERNSENEGEYEVNMKAVSFES